MKYIIPFTDALAIHPEISGGKGANLGILTQRGFPVPPGFIITSQAYRNFLAGTHGVLDSVRKFHVSDPTVLLAESLALRTQLLSFPLPSDLLREITANLTNFPAETSFSVRSSSTMEDLAGAAFAGQHDTFLNCVGVDNIVEKVKACFVSLWVDRAIAYRQQQGFDQLSATMAVVVQKMVFSETAGVGFSVNPVAGNLEEIIIDANYGLGESVVNGEHEVDHYLVDKKTLVLKNSSIAKKSHRIIASGSGTTVETIPENLRGKPSLSGRNLEDVSRLVADVEKSYGFPQDLEWGISGGKVYLLQSRPITSIAPRWTRDESAERFPNVLTPLTWAIVEEGFHRSLTYSLRLMAYPPFNGKWFAMHGHYIYGNHNAVKLYAGKIPFSITSLDQLRDIIPYLRETFSWVQQLPVTWFRDLDRYLITIGELMSEPLEGKTAGQVWEYVKRVNRLGSDYFLPNIAISLTQGVLYKLLGIMLKLSVGEKEAQHIFDRLMAYAETKTGIINKELFEIAQIIRSTPELENALKNMDTREFVRKHLSKFPVFQARFSKFLSDHGHREVDFDAYSPTWLELPWVVLDSIKLILQSPMEALPSSKERDLKERAQKAEFELFSQLPQELHFFYHEVIRLARLYTTLDDTEHYQTTRLTLPLRRGLIELGSRLAKCGIVADPLDIFFAMPGDIEKALNDRLDGLKDVISKNKAAYLTDKHRSPEWVLGESPEEKAPSNFISGFAGSHGVAEGSVYIVLSTEDFSKFPKGAVLVARTTSPTWTPLFYSAAAVITESGGPLSHGAVTAREMQIPAVMSALECLKRLKNGDRVRVDGTNGKVYIL